MWRPRFAGWPLRTNPSMLDLKNVTLWACVWTPDEALIDRTFRAVRYCTTLADFGEVIFFCCVDPSIRDSCKWRQVIIPRLDINRWNIFINREIPKHIHTGFSLSVHEDGFILDPALWKPEFFNYDYIGAPWPDGVVGNQGFCLESQKMLQAKVKLSHSAADSEIPSDVFLCRNHRRELEHRGVRFAPQAVGEQFSTEMYGEEKPSFGFHGRQASPGKYRRGWEQIAKSEEGKIAVLTGHLDNYGRLAKHTIYSNKVEYCNRHGYELFVDTSIRQKFQDTRSHASGFSWSRMEHMAEIVESGQFSWVWVVGCDTLVTNLTTPLESITQLADATGVESIPFPRCPPFPNSTAPPPVIRWIPPRNHPTTGRKHLIACGERVTAIQADSFLVRGSKEGGGYLRAILSHYPQYRHHPWVENQVMIDLIEQYAAITLLVPQHLLNAYDYSCFLHINPAYGEGRDCYGNRGQWQPGDFLIHWPGITLEHRMQLLDRYLPKIVK